MTLTQTLLHLTNFRSPFLRTLIPAIGTAFAIQSAVAVPSILLQSERFYDLSGSLTYLSVVGLSLWLPGLRERGGSGGGGIEWSKLLEAFSKNAPPNALNWRQVVLSAAVGVWATRLGSYLFMRILGDGHDSRFDEIKKSPPRFLAAFTAQATWVSLCCLPVIALNALPRPLLTTLPTLLLTDILGLLLFTGGLTFEILADRQKSAWSAAKKRKEHDEDFLTSGLWSKSRHPNYFGEATLWTGIAVMSAGVLAGRVGQLGMGTSAWGIGGRVLALGIAGVSPAFVSFLLLKVSGVPLSEGKYSVTLNPTEDSNPTSSQARDSPL
ncbi:hypothetical protein SS1G_11387 [Sclerotinia sclerotiorum 1980 UF-70]|uniref:Uncharacterized protein n=1 Tax=Sclerotinia sclerotiorum (strain ATCC 18683 / 1980 / Ss-1) TaxID=665079 RepID=A7F1B7_SCLS1|nr:hypothetical protein SS1G_11387 [Sclerotinia sclerotiorum 1980 UF-70]EDN95509.1 hypothetical protein SS1G_11387 [Sclerotinia sclerotiorum 1980 UF-70]